MRERRGDGPDRPSFGHALIKICGLREPEHARAAVAAGADLLGFVFASARRRVTPEAARLAIEAARRASPGRRVLAVGVFVDASAAEMNDVAEAAGLDLLQLHGAEPAAMLGALTRPVIKALRPSPGTTVDAAMELIEGYRAVPNAPVAFLVDGLSPAAAGGEGVRTDWVLAADLARRVPLVLAGGLDSANVGGAIGSVRPRGVDVSSGVETGGVKDVERIRAFVEVATGAFGVPRDRRIWEVD
jgi:phosphoribosylanthranilate isomerase